MAAKCSVLFLLCVTNGVLIGEASPKIPASSLSPWYCQRLVPAFITAALTPCTYPCLFLSPHQNPRIIVQPEQDGSPCRAGKCRGSVCRPILHQAILKRKKRFICLYTFVKWIKAKRKLEELKKVIRELEREVERRSSGAMNSPLAGAAGATGLIPSGLAGGTGLNVGNDGNSFPGTLSSGSLGAGMTGRSPAGYPAGERTGNADSNTVFPGMMGRLGSEMGNNGPASTGNLAAGTFGHVHENAGGSGILNHGNNFESGSGSGSGLGSNMAGTAGASGIGGTREVAGATRASGNLRIPNLEGGLGIASRRMSISGSSSVVSVARGGANTGDVSLNTVGIAAGSSATTGNASPVSNSLSITNPRGNSNANFGISAIPP